MGGSRRVVPMVLLNGGEEAAKPKGPPPRARAPGGAMDRYAMMKQINMSQQDQEDDRQAAAEERKAKRAEINARRNEIKMMEKEDYTGTPDGDARLRRWECRLLMQEEEVRMKRFLREEKEQKQREIERGKREEEQKKREAILAERKKEEEKRREELKQEAAKKEEERKLRMKKLKEAADARAKAAFEAEKKKLEAKERAELMKAQEVESQAIERETMQLEEEYERYRLQKVKEEMEARALVEAEERKWKEWEEEEDRREEEENRKRRERMAAQMNSDRHRRKQLHGVRKEKLQGKPSEAKPLQPKTSVADMRKAIVAPKGKKASVMIAPGAAPVKEVEARVTIPEEVVKSLGKPVEALTGAQLQTEKRRCAGMKRKTKMEIKSWCEKFKQENGGREPSASDKEAILPLYQKFAAIEQRLADVQRKIDNPTQATPATAPAVTQPQPPATAPKVAAVKLAPAVNVGKPLSGMSEQQLTSEQRRCVGMKRKKKLAIKTWCEDFKKANGHEPSVEEKGEIQAMYAEYSAYDERLTDIKARLAAIQNGEALPEEAASVPAETQASSRNPKLEDIESMTLPQLVESYQSINLSYTNNLTWIEQWQNAENEAGAAEQIRLLSEENQILKPLVDSLHENMKKFEDSPFAYVTSVAEESPAHAAGILADDYISRVGTVTLSDGANALQKIAAECKENSGKEVTLCLQRWKDDQYEAIYTSIYPYQWNENNPEDTLGWELTSCQDSSAEVDKKVTPGKKPQAFAQVVSISEEGPAAASGLVAGDYLLSFGELGFDNFTEYSDEAIVNAILEVAQANANTEVVVQVLRHGIDTPEKLSLIIVPCVADGAVFLGCDLRCCTENSETAAGASDSDVPFVLVEKVMDESPAANAGLQEGDYVLKIGHITSLTENYLDELSTYIQNMIDTPVSLRVQRWSESWDSSSELDIEVVPCQWSDGASLVGCEFTPCDETANEEYAQEAGNVLPLMIVEVVEEGSPAAEAGVVAGDVVIEYDGKTDLPEGDLTAFLSAYEGQELNLKIQRWEGWDCHAMELTVKPREWSGEGKFGCSFCTYEEYCNKMEQNLPEFPCKECLSCQELDTSAHAAAYSGHYECIEYMSQYFDVFCLDRNERTPLFYASFSNQYDIVLLLVSMHPEGVFEGDMNGDTPLHAAASGNALNCIDLLLEYDADVNQANNSGVTPVHMAADKETMETLYNAGADVLSPDSEGRLPLHLACSSGDLEIVEFLSELCPEFIHCEDNDGNTPLHEAAQSGFLEGLKSLIAIDSNPKAITKRNYADKSVLDLAKESDREECVRFLDQVLS